MAGRRAARPSPWGPAAPALALLLAACSEPPPGPGSAETPDRAARTDPLVVRVTGRDYRWYYRYPGEDGVLGTPDDPRAERDLHLPAETPVRLELKSEDFVYSLLFPHLDESKIAVPGRTFHLEFTTESPAVHELMGAQMCGFAHPDLLVDVVVMDGDEFAEWLRAATER